ncbi:MAG TPA: hypothetical protein VHX88_19375, partial [Solirubrobacteraceae bacterium]|nr:hypothetical protein [Solirubrobacteraceae bacterium]
MLHQAVLVLAADKSKAPFYIVGGAFAVWAVVLGAIGLTNPDFPGNLGGQRVVMGISVLLMAGAIGSAIATASRAVKAQAATISKAPTAPAPAPAGPIAVSANPTGLLKFNTTAISARAGSDTFDFTNDSPLAHNFTIEQAGKVIAATPTFDHGTKSFTVTLKAGT